jgi:Lrp/AsnC family transcriptional regulator, leucine-responsive regulatory protein
VCRKIALVEPQRLGYGTFAFVQVVVEGRRNDQSFVKAVQALPQVLELHRMSGERTYLLKVCAPDVPQLKAFVDAAIGRCGGVSRMQITIALDPLKHRVTGVPARA